MMTRHRRTLRGEVEFGSLGETRAGVLDVDEEAPRGKARAVGEWPMEALQAPISALPSLVSGWLCRAVCCEDWAPWQMNRPGLRVALNGARALLSRFVVASSASLSPSYALRPVWPPQSSPSSASYARSPRAAAPTSSRAHALVSCPVAPQQWRCTYHDELHEQCTHPYSSLFVGPHELAGREECEHVTNVAMNWRLERRQGGSRGPGPSRDLSRCFYREAHSLSSPCALQERGPGQ